MEIKIKNSNSDKGNYKVVTWTVNTTGNQINDEICELASFSGIDANSSFSTYIMPYCDVKRKYWQEHGLKEVNTRRIRFLMDWHEDKVLNTKTELYGLRDFLNWLEVIKGSSAGIILVCYEPNDFISQILLESLHRCRLNERFFKVVHSSINCYDICKSKYGNRVKYCSISNITKLLFDDDTNFKRTLSRAKGCHKIITHIKGEENNFEEFIEPYIKSILPKQQLQNQGQKMQKVTAKEAKKPTSRRVSFELSNKPGPKKISGDKCEINEDKSINKLQVQGETPTYSPPENYLKYKIIGWAANTTGHRPKSEIFHITAFSPDSMFSQYIMPKKYINLFKCKHKIRVIKENDTKKLKDLKTQKILETKLEKSVLEDFIQWLEQIKGNDGEGIIILYHENMKYSLLILLESLRRCHLTEAFSNVVDGFVNTYNVSENKCAQVTKSFGLKNLAELLLKKKIEFENAMVRAKVCYEIIEYLTQDKVGGLANENVEMLNLIQPFVNTISDEEKQLEQFKIKFNKKRQTKSKKKVKQPEVVSSAEK